MIYEENTNNNFNKNQILNNDNNENPVLNNIDNEKQIFNNDDNENENLNDIDIEMSLDSTLFRPANWINEISNLIDKALYQAWKKNELVDVLSRLNEKENNT